jgi:hypothetical protein
MSRKIVTTDPAQWPKPKFRPGQTVRRKGGFPQHYQIVGMEIEEDWNGKPYWAYYLNAQDDSIEEDKLELASKE